AADASYASDAGHGATGVIEEGLIACGHRTKEVARPVVAHARPAGTLPFLQVFDGKFIRFRSHQPVRHEVCSPWFASKGSLKAASPTIGCRAGLRRSEA